MFTSPTTIILGAGASYEFGAPLGAALWDQVAQNTQLLAKRYASRAGGTLTRELNPVGNENLTPEARAYYNEIERLLTEDAVAIDGIMGEAGISARLNLKLNTVLQKIAERVADANVHQSVDDFLRDNPKLLPPLRVLMAASVFQGLYESKESYPSEWRLRPLVFEKRFTSPHTKAKVTAKVDNWLLRFVGMCRPILIKAGSTPHKVKVISFNYDRLMETVLERYWQKAERDFPPLCDCFEFIYPYGSFSEFPDTVQRPGKWLQEQSQGIGLATGEGNAKSKAVRTALNEAVQVFSIGFSFTESNIALLGLQQAHGPRLFVQNFQDQDTRLKAMLKQRFDKATTFTAPLAQLVSDGFFEQVGPGPGFRVVPVSIG